MKKLSLILAVLALTGCHADYSSPVTYTEEKVAEDPMTIYGVPRSLCIPMSMTTYSHMQTAVCFIDVN